MPTRSFAAIALLVACGAPPATPQLANRGGPPEVAQVVRPFVVDAYTTCVPHRITVSIDDVPTATVAITCPPPRPPMPGGVIVTDSDDTRTFDGPPLRIAAGRHTIGARDDASGRSATITASFPVYGHAPPPHTRPLADVIVVRDDADFIRVDLDVRALLILL